MQHPVRGSVHFQKHVGKMRTKTLWVQEPYLANILSGQKTVEVRVGYGNINRLVVGDRLMVNARYPYIIKRIGRYESFEELLKVEDAAAIAPDVAAHQLLEKMRSIYPMEKEALGAIALEIEPE